MKRPALLTAVLSAAFACQGGGDSKPDGRVATLDGFAFEVPADWNRVDTHAPRAVTATWTPDVEVNDRKESLVVRRTQVNAATGKAGLSEIERALVSAQRALPDVTVTQVPSRFTTPRGLHGVRLEADFVPDGKRQRYHRVHAVVIDEGNALVHVMYTAAQPDGEQEALRLVLDSLHRGEG